MKHTQFKFVSKVWQYPGMSGWFFVTLPIEVTKDIDSGFADLKRGFGSLPVFVTVGDTKWRTSIFPDKSTQCYLLPLKLAIRKKENIQESDTITFLIEIIT